MEEVTPTSILSDIILHPDSQKDTKNDPGQRGTNVNIVEGIEKTVRCLYFTESLRCAHQSSGNNTEIDPKRNPKNIVYNKTIHNYTYIITTAEGGLEVSGAFVLHTIGW